MGSGLSVPDQCKIRRKSSTIFVQMNKVSQIEYDFRLSLRLGKIPKSTIVLRKYSCS